MAVSANEVGEKVMGLFSDTEQSSARFSECRNYRYELRRVWGDGPLVNFIMLNPSTADEVNNDPTIERQCRRIRKWGLGHGGLVVTNIFAWRSTDPRVLKTLPDPVGPENDRVITDVARDAGLVICAWGTHGELLGRGKAVAHRLSAISPLHYLKMSDSGHPWHPLYLSYDLKPQVWEISR
jgi:hypothetical protein